MTITDFLDSYEREFTIRKAGHADAARSCEEALDALRQIRERLQGQPNDMDRPDRLVHHKIG